jgi:hypothetical protein
MFLGLFDSLFLQLLIQFLHFLLVVLVHNIFDLLQVQIRFRCVVFRLLLFARLPVVVLPGLELGLGDLGLRHLRVVLQAGLVIEIVVFEVAETVAALWLLAEARGLALCATRWRALATARWASVLESAAVTRLESFDEGHEQGLVS